MWSYDEYTVGKFWSLSEEGWNPPLAFKVPVKAESESGMKLFQYAILFRARETKAMRDEGRTAKVQIIKDVTSVVAKDDAEVRLVAGREVPAEYLDRLDQVEILVRPF